jgi:lipoprotein Spr
LASCDVTKRSSATKTPASSSASSKSDNLRLFLLKYIDSQWRVNFGCIRSNFRYPATTGTVLVNPVDKTEGFYSLQFKYAILLDAPVEEMLDHQLIEFLESWYGTPYTMGGVDKTGVDCSAFVQSLMLTMYGVNVPRTSQEQYDQCKRISKNKMVEGDLVFFRTQKKKGVSHVGVYLRNNKFVHASTSSGVMISDLGEEYYSKRFVGSEGIKQPDHKPNEIVELISGLLFHSLLRNLTLLNSDAKRV